MGNDLKPILLTGASGYLGRYVFDCLQKKGLQVIPVSFHGNVGIACDLTNPHDVEKLLKRFNPSSIIHCAAVVPKNKIEYDDTSMAIKNVKMIENLVDNALCNIIFTSSMTVYENVIHFPVSEDDIQPYQIPKTEYAHGKWMAEQILLSRQFPGDLAFRFPGLFGLPRRSGLIYNATKAFLTGESFLIESPPPIWAAMMVQDAAEFLVRAVQGPSLLQSQAINAGYHGEFTVHSVVQKIANICGVGWKGQPLSERPFSMSLARFESRYGQVKVSFSQRLEQFIYSVKADLGI
jgi:nucleoside-diphosphate-sugar epimerase